jgi:aminopeptidase YwaD
MPLKRTMKQCVIPLVILLAAVSFLAAAQSSSPEITAADLRDHIQYLASDELEGRGSGTEGNRKAAEYIAGLLKKYGISPAGDNGGYLQPFKFVSAVKLGPQNTFTLESKGAAPQTLEVSKDFRPLGFSSTGTVSGPLVFAAYGISAADKNYDDYAGLDVKGKIVVLLRFAPDGDSPRSEFGRRTDPREKARVAREKGAAGIIMLIGPATDPEDELMKLAFDQSPGNSGIPIVSMKRAALQPVFAGLGKDLRAIQDSIKAKKTPIVFEMEGATATMSTDVQTLKATTANIIGVLEGTDPALKNEYLILGAHMDHLGYGGAGSGSTRPDTFAIHNGADDNASGTAGVLEMAQKFASARADLKRSLVFVFFSAEELGTIGSQYYVDHPPVPLTQTVAMLNMDMIGRLQGKALTVGGTGTASIWNDLMAKYNPDSSFAIKAEPDGFGPSDHSSFYGKNIPVLFFFTGIHDDYHKPSDDWDKINFAGEEKVVRYAYNIAHDVADGNLKPVYVRVESAPRPAGGDSRGFNVTLGIVPDVGWSGEGTKVSVVQPNRPGEKAGLKGGDVIVKMAGKKILNVYDYMGILGELKVGDQVEIEVLRSGETVILHATMERRK